MAEEKLTSEIRARIKAAYEFITKKPISDADFEQVWESLDPDSREGLWAIAMGNFEIPMVEEIEEETKPQKERKYFKRRTGGEGPSANQIRR